VDTPYNRTDTIRRLLKLILIDTAATATAHASSKHQARAHWLSHF